MLSHRKFKVLAIDPGTREMGVAFLENGNLLYHGVKVLRNGIAPHERLRRGREAVRRLIDDFKPDVLVLEKTFFARNRNVALLNVLSDEIAALGKRRGLQVMSFAPSTIKKRICGNGQASKEAVARAVCAKFPELKAYLSANRKWKNRFHANMFDAVALGILVEQPQIQSESR